METKVCNGPTCNNTEKPISEFNKDKSRKDGLSPYCRDCQSYYHRARYRTPDGRKVKLRYQEKYRKTELGKKVNNRGYRKHAKRHPNRRRARAAVNNAVAKGNLPRVDSHQCSFPGCEKPAEQYHHHSYEPAYWLDVIPYCLAHHKQIDNAQ